MPQSIADFFFIAGLEGHEAAITGREEKPARSETGNEAAVSVESKTESIRANGSRNSLLAQVHRQSYTPQDTATTSTSTGQVDGMSVAESLHRPETWRTSTTT